MKHDEPFHGVQVEVGEDEFKIYGTAHMVGDTVNDFTLNIPECQCRGAGGSAWTYCPRMALNYLYIGNKDNTERAILKWIKEH